MNDVNSLIKKVSDESKLSLDEIKSKMAERKERTHGLLSDYGALYAVAKEYGIDLSENGLQLSEISSIKPQSSVNICGKVSMIYSQRDFKRKDNTTGKFASIVLMDKTGEVRIVLWNGNSDVTKKMHVGDVLLVRNGFVKDNKGVIEVHAGNLTGLTINPKGVDVDLPSVEEKITPIAGLKDGMDSATLICRVNSYYPTTEFKRPDGTTGKRASFIAQDESSTVRVVLWGVNADVNLKEGDVVKLENIYTRLGLNSEVEVQAGNRSRLLPSDSKLNLPAIEKKIQAGEVKIGEVKADMKGFTTTARVVRIYPPRDYSNGKMSSLIIADGTGSMRAVFWNEKSEIAGELKEGDAIRIVNAYSKANLNNEPEIHVGRYGEVLVNQSLNLPSMEELGKSASVEKNIADLENNEKNIKIKGHVVDINVEKPIFYMTCSSCSKKVQNLGGDWFCESCGSIEPTSNMILSLILEDDTGNVRVVLFKENAERLAGMDVEEATNQIGESQDEAAPAKQIRERLLNKELCLVGRVRYNEYGDQIEFLVDSLA
ncbi:MAG: OB-fold nucleic acid binding domain-containing protein [Candidatus Altiarchaeota archaeon]